MPYVSVRTSRNTRVGGGPGFWLLVILFAWPFYALGFVLKATAALAGWALREAETRQTRKTTAAARKPTPRATAAIEDAVPEDARPAMTRRVATRAPDPPHRQRVIAFSVTCTLLAALLVLAVLSAARFH